MTKMFKYFYFGQNFIRLENMIHIIYVSKYFKQKISFYYLRVYKKPGLVGSFKNLDKLVAFDQY